MKGEPPWWEVAPPQEKKLESQVLLVHPASWRSAFQTRPANTGKNNIRFGKAGHYKRDCDLQGVPYRFVVSTQAINTPCVAEKIIFWKLQVDLEFWRSPRWFGGKKFTSKKGKTNLKTCIVQVLEIIYIFSRNGFAESSRQELQPQIRSHNPLSSSASWIFPTHVPRKPPRFNPNTCAKMFPIILKSNGYEASLTPVIPMMWKSFFLLKPDMKIHFHLNLRQGR